MDVVFVFVMLAVAHSEMKNHESEYVVPVGQQIVESKNSTQDGKERLATLNTSEDGFYLAQKDFEMRGSGEIFGTRQAGVSEFKVADLRKHGDIAVQASQLLERQEDTVSFISNLPKRHKLPDLYEQTIHQFASQADSS